MPDKPDTPVTESIYIGPLELIGNKAVLNVPPNTVRPSTKLICVAGTYWVRNYGFALSDSRGWDLIKPEQFLELV